jgi:ribonucleoside-diphosphate reductase alpha chain
MMAAAQPFLSGAISKTVNMPRDTTPADVADAYIEGWRLGLKALAVYRDGSKESQPLSTSTEADQKADKQKAAPRRERLPDTRRSITHKFSIAGHEGYITVGLYEDGRPGELFITMAKEGSTVGGLMDCFGTAVSMSLQYGVPLDVYVNKFSHTRFEPMGHTKNPDIRIAKSLVDYIFRWLGITFLAGYREENANMAPEPAAAASSEDAPGQTKPAVKMTGGQDTGARQPKPAAKASEAKAASPKANPNGKTNGHANGHTNGHSNGNGHGADAGLAVLVRPTVDVAKISSRGEQFANFQTDAPSCDNCGSITVRNGNCYLCHNCGNSMGCS